MQVQAVLAHLAVEAFNERVLRRFSWLDKVQLHAGFFRPEVHRFRRELRAIVTDDGPRQFPRDAVEFACHSVT